MKGLQRNARGMYERECKLPGERRGMQGNTRGTYGSGCKVPEECRGMHGNAGECQGRMAVSVKCQGNAGE